MSGLCASQLPLERWPVRIASGPQEQARGRLVSENYFDVFGVRAAIGRLFVQSEATAVGSDPYAVIGYDYWQRRFGGNSSVVGTTICIRHAALVIVGVAAPGFRGETVDIRSDRALPGSHWYLRGAFLQRRSTRKRIRYSHGPWCGNEPDCRHGSRRDRICHRRRLNRRPGCCGCRRSFACRAIICHPGNLPSLVSRSL